MADLSCPLGHSFVTLIKMSAFLTFIGDEVLSYDKEGLIQSYAAYPFPDGPDEDGDGDESRVSTSEAPFPPLTLTTFQAFATLGDNAVNLHITEYVSKMYKITISTLRLFLVACRCGRTALPSSQRAASPKRSRNSSRTKRWPNEFALRTQSYGNISI